MSQASVGFPWFIVSVLVVGFLPGLLLLIAGRRGKRIDDHPVCRDCGFDLFGTLEPAAGQHRECPECGTRREPRIGNRRRRTPLAWAGVLLMLASVCVAGVWGYGRVDSAWLANYKPVWLLRWEARSTGADAAEVALNELIDRLQNGQLSNTTVELLLDDAVVHGPAGNPALMNATLGNAWDVLAVDLLRRGAGTPQQHEMIGRSWLETTVEVRPKVRVGKSIPVLVKQRQWGPDNGLGLYKKFDYPELIAPDRRYKIGVSSEGGLGRRRGGGGRSWGSSGTSIRPGADMPRGLSVGAHEFPVALDIVIMDGRNGSTLARWSETHAVRFEYVDESGDPIELIHDPALAVKVEQAVELRDGELVIQRYGINSMLDFNSVHADMAYQLYAQRGEQKRKLSTVAAKAQNGGYGFGLGGEVPEEWEDGALVDLVFEPDPDVARKTTDMTRILDHRFVIEDVKIVRPANP